MPDSSGVGVDEADYAVCNVVDWEVDSVSKLCTIQGPTSFFSGLNFQFIELISAASENTSFEDCGLNSLLMRWSLPAPSLGRFRFTNIL